MRSREIPLIAFDGQYPRFMGEVGIEPSEKTKRPAEQKQCRALVLKTETIFRR